MTFTGSYRPQDVQFLLKPIPVEMIESVADKERLIQSGARHYSEMLTPERLPSARYRTLFLDAVASNCDRMARDCVSLARAVVERYGPRPTLISLARAGTPVGVILTHLIRQITGGPVAHYSVSIIRDRGIDANALRHVLAQGHAAESIVFIDGWTGKGVITRELHSTIEQFNASNGTALRPDLFVLADLAGCASYAATSEDYLIPSSILNATVSGLVSRSVLNEHVGEDDFHGCVFFEEFADHDLSVWFVQQVLERAVPWMQPASMASAPAYDKARVAQTSAAFMRAELTRQGLTDANLIKPGIGEATRVLLRRQPHCVIVRDRQQACVSHLLALAAEKSVRVEERADLPYHAAAIIKGVIDA